MNSKLSLRISIYASHINQFQDKVDKRPNSPTYGLMAVWCDQLYKWRSGGQRMLRQALKPELNFRPPQPCEIAQLVHCPA
jgi:hypothetical protein